MLPLSEKLRSELLGLRSEPRDEIADDVFYYALGVQEACGDVTEEEYFSRLSEIGVVPRCISIIKDNYHGTGLKYVRVYCRSLRDAEATVKHINDYPRGREWAKLKVGDQPWRRSLEHQLQLFIKYGGETVAADEIFHAVGKEPFLDEIVKAAVRTFPVEKTSVVAKSLWEAACASKDHPDMYRGVAERPEPTRATLATGCWEN